MRRTRHSALHPRGRRVPSSYPRAYEQDATLADGREVHIRPIVPDDVHELKRAVAEADAETLYNRFLGGRPPKTDEEFAHLVEVDYARRFAVVALDHTGHGVGIARYETLPDGHSAEVAVAVDPAWRRVGLATTLLRVLGAAAVEHGIEQLGVEFLLANVDVRSLLTDSRLPVVIHGNQGVADARIDLTALLGEPGAGDSGFGDVVLPGPVAGHRDALGRRRVAEEEHVEHS